MVKISQKGIAHILVVLILLAGLGATLYLSQKPQIFKPRAEEASTPSQSYQPKFNGYIVEFKTEPLIKTKERLKTSGKAPSEVDQELEVSKNNISAEHEQAKEDILRRLGKNGIAGSRPGSNDEIPPNNLTILQEYTTIFNGIALDITSEDAERVKQSPFVKKVYPNLEVKASLSESVPMINADKVWQQTDSQGLTITGKDIRIAIIDTGIDYTHPDLGQTPVTDRTFERITTETLQFPTVRFLTQPDVPDEIDNDQLFSINNNRITYYSGDKLLLRGFQDNSSQVINLPDPQLKGIIRITLKDNLIAYVAIDGDSRATLYVYNIDSQIHKKIRDLVMVKQLSIASGKVIYDSGRTMGTLFMYDVTTGIETAIDNSLWFPDFDPRNEYFIPFASENFIIGSVVRYNCHNKLVVYDINTGTARDVTPPENGIIVDFQGTKILYLACNGENFDTSGLNFYYLYDIITGEAKRLSYVPYRVSGTQVVSTDYGYYSDLNVSVKGAITSNLIYFSKSFYDQALVAYDKRLNRYVEINLLKAAYGVGAQENKVCFSSDDYHLYCHTYDASNPYTLSTNIYNNKVVEGYDFVNSDANPYDDNGHGTHVASIAAGSGSLKGVAPDAKLVAYKVLDYRGNGFVATIIAAIEKTVQDRLDNNPDNDIDIINLSLGVLCNGYSESCGPDDPQSKAVDNAVESGITIVTAAGNSGPDPATIGSPGTARKAITAGAVNKQGRRASFSSRGPVNVDGQTIDKPDIVAPGVAICAAEHGHFKSDKRCLDDRHISLDGTSMAAPHVTGIVALLKQLHPDWSTEQVKNTIRTGAQPLEDIDSTTQGQGLVNALKTLFPNLVPNPTPAPVPLVSLQQAATIPKADSILARESGIDMDNDGNREFIISRKEKNETLIEIYENTAGNSSIKVHTLPLPGSDLYHELMDTGDSDGDGLPEILIARAVDEVEFHVTSLSLYESISLNSYPTRLIWELTGGTDAKIADLDSDGKKEIIVGGSYENRFAMIAVYENTEDNVYAQKYKTRMNYVVKSLDITDLDNDGKKEIIAAGWGFSANPIRMFGQVDLFENTGNDSYQKVWSNGLTASDGFDFYPDRIVSAGDLDGDGKNEFVVAGLKEDRNQDEIVLQIFETTGNNVNQKIADFSLMHPDARTARDLVIGNLIGDNKKEIIFAAGRKIALLKNLADNTYERILLYTHPSEVSQLAVSNHNQDRRTELIINGKDNTGVYQLSTLPSPTPFPAFSLNASISGPAHWVRGIPATFTGTFEDSSGNLLQGEVWLVRTDVQSIGTNCPSGVVINNIACRLGLNTLSGSSGIISSNYAFSPGTYFVFVQAYNSTSRKCSAAFENLGPDWSDCGDSDFIILNVL